MEMHNSIEIIKMESINFQSIEQPEGKEGNFQKCLICEKEMVSDAGVTGHCKLCGMATESTKDFCCNSCEKNFKGWSSWSKRKRIKRK